MRSIKSSCNAVTPVSRSWRKPIRPPMWPSIFRPSKMHSPWFTSELTSEQHATAGPCISPDFSFDPAPLLSYVQPQAGDANPADREDDASGLDTPPLASPETPRIEGARLS